MSIVAVQCASIFVASFVIAAHYSEFSWIQTLLAATVVGYLPSFLEQSQFTADGRYWAWFATHPLWQRMSSTKATLHFETPQTYDKQYLFASHPHGPTSWHHGIMMSGTSTPSFHAIIPGDRRRHLGTSVVFRVPIYRECLLWLGVVNASRCVANAVLKSGKMFSHFGR
jgi:2-acylglycerol O-acyltransferase 2